VTRAYDDGARRFFLVFEPATGDAERHLSAIYVRLRSVSKVLLTSDVTVTS
jgi:hypothetical protein